MKIFNEVIFLSTTYGGIHKPRGQLRGRGLSQMAMHATTETLFNKSVHVFDGWPLIEYQIYNIKYFVKYDETDITI